MIVLPVTHAHSKLEKSRLQQEFDSNENMGRKCADLRKRADKRERLCVSESESDLSWVWVW